MLTSKAPRTPASSMVSRFAAASTVSSVSQPPCMYLQAFGTQGSGNELGRC